MTRIKFTITVVFYTDS